MNNKRQRNKLFTMLMLVMALFIPQWGWAQTATQPKKGDGTQENPYQISTAEELAWFRDYVNENIANNMACAKLIKDIDMSSVCYPASGDVEEKSWTPIGSSTSVWNGTFDGDNHAINNLYISSKERFTGLFGNVGQYPKVATIRNIKFNNAIVESSNSYIAVLVGYVSNGEISGITVHSGSVYSASDYVGGIVGIADYDVKIVECENHANITGNNYVGGIFGWFMNAPTADGYIQKCSNFANIRCTGKYAGGIGGHLNGGTIAACANYGDIKGTYIGGIVGFVSQDDGSTCLKNSFTCGNIEGTDNRSGLVVGIDPRNVGTLEGVVAYCSDATIKVNNQTIESKAIGMGQFGNVDNGIIEGYTLKELQEGKATWLLNGSKAEGSLSWYQKLGENGDAYPVLAKTSDNTVYNNYFTCGGDKVDVFANIEENEHKVYLSHQYSLATTPDEGYTNLYSTSCSVCHADEVGIKYIKDFCGITGNNLKLTYADGKYYAEAVTLTDGVAYNSPVDIEVADFKYIRTFDAYKWQPLYVPFRMSLEQLTGNGLSVATPVDIEVVDETITRLNVKKLKSGSSKANYPSLIMCDSDGEKTIELADVTLSAAKEGAIDCMSMTRYYVFNGVYQANKNLASNSEDAINYIMKDGGLVLRNDDDVPAPQSWYMNVKIRQNPFGGADEPLSSDAKAMPIYVIGEGYATGIENVNAAEEHIQQGIYDLQGRKLNQEPASGIYIKDGKKYVK